MWRTKSANDILTLSGQKIGFRFSENVVPLRQLGDCLHDILNAFIINFFDARREQWAITRAATLLTLVFFHFQVTLDTPVDNFPFAQFCEARVSLKEMIHIVEEAFL